MTPVQYTSQPDISSTSVKVAVSSGNKQIEARGSDPALYNYHVTFRTSSSSDQTVHSYYIQFAAIYAHFYLVTVTSANGVQHTTHLPTANNRATT
jgi:phage-related protein